MLSLLWGKYLGVEWLDQRVVVVVQLLNLVRLFAALWTVAHQAPLSMGLSRQEYWSGLPFPPPGDLPNPGIKPKSLALQADSLPSEPPGKPQIPDQRVGVRNFHAFFFFKVVPFYIPCTRSHQSSGGSQHFVLVSFSILALLVGKCGFSLWF